MAIDDGRKLFVAGLPDSITEAVLRQLFEATGGTVVEVSVPRDRATGRPRGFAFVTLSTEAQATAARDSLDNSMQSGRSISVRPFQSAPPKRGEARERRDFGGERRDFGGDRRDFGGERRERFDRGERPDRSGPRGGTDDRTLYLGNLPYDAATADVERVLQDAGVGPIVRVTLPQDADGRPRGFGFVTLGSADSAQSAVEALSAVEIGGRRISASIARGRGERGPRPQRGPGGPEHRPRSDAGGPPPYGERPDSMAFGPPPGPPPDENRRGDGRRRKEKKKKKGAGAGRGPERDEGRRGTGDRGGRASRRGRWMDDGDDY
jgi:RNA recognition motif-containing protein